MAKARRLKEYESWSRHLPGPEIPASISYGKVLAGPVGTANAPVLDGTPSFRSIFPEDLPASTVYSNSLTQTEFSTLVVGTFGDDQVKISTDPSGSPSVVATGQHPELVIAAETIRMVGATTFESTVSAVAFNTLDGRLTPQIQVICPAAAFTLLNSTAVQPVFAPAHDTIAIAAETAYMFDGQYLLTTGTTTHTKTISFVLGGGASVDSCMWSSTAGLQSYINTGVSSAFTAIFNSVAGGLVGNSSGVANALICFRGIVRVGSGGTMVPSIKFDTAPGATNSTLIGSFLNIYPLGVGNIENVGDLVS